MNLDFDYAWLAPARGVRTPSHRETMANFRLSVADRVLTANRSISADAELEEPRDSVQVSLFPLAEFIAANWWALLYEPQKTPTDVQAYSGRHQIVRHRDGFAYPDVAFYGADSRVLVMASASRIVSAGIEFFTELSGTEQNTLDRNRTEQVLLSFLGAVLDRLSDDDDRDWLAEKLEGIRHSKNDPNENEYCTLAGMLGADPYDEGDALELAITTVRTTLGSALAREVFATSELSSVIDRAQSIKSVADRAISKSRLVAQHVEGLKKSFATRIGKASPGGFSSSWERGYVAANELRRVLALDGDRPLPTDDLLQTKLFGGELSDGARIADWAALGARGIGVDDSRGFGIAIDTSSRMHPRFQLAATFGDYLFCGDGDIFLSTGASTDRQKTNRAFAAEFLAPIDAIKVRLAGGRATPDQLRQLAGHFGVSPTTIRYQIINQLPELLPIAV